MKKYSQKLMYACGLLATTLLCLPACSSTPEQTVYKVTVAAQAEDGEQVILKALADAYEALHPEVDIIIKDFAGKNYNELMVDYTMDPSAMPMILWNDDRDFAPYAKGGYFEDLRPYYESSSDTDYSLYYETMLDSASYTGEYRPTTSYTGTTTKELNDSADYGLYFAPRDYNEIAIVYNKTKFQKYGITVPDLNDWNWDSFINLIHTTGEKLVTEGGRNEVNTKVIYLHSSYEPVFTSIFTELNSDGIVKNGQINIGSNTNRQIYSDLLNNIYNYQTICTVDDEQDISKRMIASDNSDFYNQRCLMTVCPRPVVYSMYNKLKENSTDIDFLPFPTKKIAAGCSGYAMCKVKTRNNQSQTVNGEKRLNKDLCWDFIKYAITHDGQEVSGTTGVSVPVLKSLRETGTWRSALSTTLNHDAFITPEELHMDIFNCFDCKNKLRTNLRTKVVSFLTGIESNNYGDSLDTWITRFTNEFNALLASAR